MRRVSVSHLGRARYLEPPGLLGWKNMCAYSEEKKWLTNTRRKLVIADTRGQPGAAGLHGLVASGYLRKPWPGFACLVCLPAIHIFPDAIASVCTAFLDAVCVRELKPGASPTLCVSNIPEGNGFLQNEALG